MAEAERNPGTGFVGIEPFVNGMAKALASIEERKLTNIRLHHGDATDVLGWLPSASLRVSILSIPTRGRSGGIGSAASCKTKRRRDRAIVRAQGEFRFASDIPDYVAWTLARLMRSSHFVGPRNRPTIGASPGPASPERATKPRLCARAACPVI